MEPFPHFDIFFSEKRLNLIHGLISYCKWEAWGLEQFCEQFQPDDKLGGIKPTLFNAYISNQSQAEFAGATSGSYVDIIVTQSLQCLGGKLISKVQLPDVWKVKKCKVNVSVRDRLPNTFAGIL